MFYRACRGRLSRYGLLLSLASVSVSRPVLGQTVMSPVLNPENGHWYQAVRVSGGITWDEARGAAEQFSLAGYRGHLITLTSEAENRFVLSQLPFFSQETWWTGGYQDRKAPDYREPGGGWRWVTGEPWSYTQWSTNPVHQPDNASGQQDAITLGAPFGNYWDDREPTVRLGGYLVEFAPPPLPTTARVGILPNPVVGGLTTVGVVGLDRPAGPGDIVVPLTSSDAAVAAVPAVVIVPQGARTALFSIITFPTSTPVTAQIVAAGPGGPRAATLRVMPSGTAMPPGNLLDNGSFERPRSRTSDPALLLSGWPITRGDVDLYQGWQQAPGEGLQSLDLVGDNGGPATIQQSFATVVGRDYLFSGWIAHHPGNPVAPEGRANVSLNGQFFVQLFHRDTRSTESEMRWARFAYRFRATRATTTLSIADVTGTWERGGLVLDGLAVTPVVPDLLTNGSFEEPDAGSAADGARPVGLPGWRVPFGSLDLLHERLWQPAPGGGSQSLDMVGSAGAGSVEQAFPTDAGRTYRLAGWLSHHPAVAEARAHLYVGGEFWAPLLHSAALHGVTIPTAMQWQPFFYLFRATGPMTTISLADVTGDAAGGAVLDHLTVSPTDEPAPGLPPVAPSGLTVRLIAPTQVELAWSDNSVDETGFEIERRSGASDWQRIATVAAESLRFSDFGVRPNTAYTYRVRAVNDSGTSGWSNEASVTTLGP